MKAQALKGSGSTVLHTPVIGIFATCDPRIDQDSRKRALFIIQSAASQLAGEIKLPDSTKVPVVYSTTLVDGEKEADIVASQFKEAGVNIMVCMPDTWAFPQLTVISLISHFPQDTPLNITCGNSAPKPGVVFAHAVSGALAQYGRLMHLNVGTWDDVGLEPRIAANTLEELIQWLYAAVTYQHLKGKRVVVFGHDSMGMETALPHVIATRNTFGIEITRLDMKLLADMLQKKAYKKSELKEFRSWLESFGKGKIELKSAADSERLDQSLAMYLIVRDLMKELGAIGGGFMSQLEWGSDHRGMPLPVADIMESLFNSTFDHLGKKPVIPYATEADMQALLTQVFLSSLSGGNPPLFMDFRKVWEAWEIKQLAKKLKVPVPDAAEWAVRGFVDGDNSGSASFDWAAKPGTGIREIMKGISFPLADAGYFPGGGNSVTFFTPAGIKGIAARLAYSSLSGMFSMVWDEAHTIELPVKLATAVAGLSTPTWPHTFVSPDHATMHEYKHYAPANHFHMVWNLPTSRLQYWMDMTNVLSATPWKNMPGLREGTDRPLPLLYILNGGENEAKKLRNK
jgi:L-fucose/D-arabinose isomerase